MISYKFIKIIFIIFLLAKIINSKIQENNIDINNYKNYIKNIMIEDCEAIKNIGNLSKNVNENNGKLILPYNVKITGNLEVENNTRTNNIYVNDKAEIRNYLDIKDDGKTYVKLEKNGWGTAKGTIWLGDGDNPKVVMSALSNGIPSEYLKINDAGIAIKGGTNITNTGINTGSISASATSNIGPFRITQEGATAYLQTSKPNLRISKNPINGGNLNNIKFDLNNSVKYDFNHDSFRSYVPQIVLDKAYSFSVYSDFKDNNNNNVKLGLFERSKLGFNLFKIFNNHVSNVIYEFEERRQAINNGETDSNLNTTGQHIGNTLNLMGGLLRGLGRGFGGLSGS